MSLKFNLGNQIPKIPVPAEGRRLQLEGAIWDYLRREPGGLSFDQAAAVKAQAIREVFQVLRNIESREKLLEEAKD